MFTCAQDCFVSISVSLLHSTVLKVPSGSNSAKLNYFSKVTLSLCMTNIGTFQNIYRIECHQDVQLIACKWGWIYSLGQWWRSCRNKTLHQNQMSQVNWYSPLICETVWGLFGFGLGCSFVLWSGFVFYLQTTPVLHETGKKPFPSCKTHTVKFCDDPSSFLPHFIAFRTKNKNPRESLIIIVCFPQTKPFCHSRCNFN